MMNTHGLYNALEHYVASEQFQESLVKATKAAWGGDTYSVELFEDGTFRVLSSNEIGNLYESPGVLLTLPTLDDSLYTDWMEDSQWTKLTEDEYWKIVFENERDEIGEDLHENLLDDLMAVAALHVRNLAFHMRLFTALPPVFLPRKRASASSMQGTAGTLPTLHRKLLHLWQAMQTV